MRLKTDNFICNQEPKNSHNTDPCTAVIGSSDISRYLLLDFSNKQSCTTLTIHRQNLGQAKELPSFIESECQSRMR